MDNNTLVSGVNEWLADQALSEPDIVMMFEGLTHRLRGIGIPLARARLTWPTLHPLFQAETVLWTHGRETEFEQFIHQESMSNAWLLSPMKHMLEHDLSILRRNLDGPNKLLDFEILNDMNDIGMTDYLVVSTEFSNQNLGDQIPRRGIFVTWCADRPGGFSNDEIQSLQKIQRRFAVACKTVVQARIANNVTKTYLGNHAGQQVLSGSIRRGDGNQTNAVVWMSDLRNSTALADTMPGDEYLKLLNTYFECTAGSVIDAGGEVLDFIGDAVLAIFPFDSESEKNCAICSATKALHLSQQAHAEISEQRKEEGLPAINYGVGLNVGSVTFGNIGVPERLSFSVIGPTVNEVARIETMTKAIGKSILASKDVAAFEPSAWVSVGEHALQGVSKRMELFTLVDADMQDMTAGPEVIDSQLADIKTTLIN